VINQLRQRAGLRAIVGNAFIAALAVFAAGCDLSTGEATANNLHQFVQVRNPVGHVRGLVLDTNNNPLPGATVTIGSRQTTTNSAGAYEIRDVEVVSVENLAGANEDTQGEHGVISIVIQPAAPTTAAPTRYLGAIVTVNPNAIVNSPSDLGGAGDDTIGGNQTVFFDGFSANAGTAFLPALTSSIEIFALRDGITGEVIANTDVALDFITVATTAGADEGATGVNYQDVSFIATSDANGRITFTNLPDNSTFEMHIDGYTCTPDDSVNEQEANACNLATENENGPTQYENFIAFLLQDSGDITNLFITSVTGRFANQAGPGLCTSAGALSATITGTTGVRFNVSETLAAGIANTSVAIYDNDAEEYVPVATVTGSGTRTIVVTTTAAFDPGADLDFYFFHPDFTDAAGNILAENSALSNPGFAQISPIDCAGPANSIVVSLVAFEAANVDVDTPVLAQVTADPVDTGDDNDLPFQQSLSSAFLDVDDDTAADDNSLSQMNFDSIDAIALSHRFEAFASITGVDDIETTAVTLVSALALDTNTVRIEFEPVAGSESYRITRNGDDAVGAQETVSADAFEANTRVATYADTDGDGNTTVNGDALQVQSVVDGTGDTFYAIVLGGTDEGDVITIEAFDDLGNAGQAGSFTVADNVRPTVSVQVSYAEDIGLDDDSILLSGAPSSIQADAGGANLSGCFTHDSNFGTAGYPAIHAGVELGSGSATFGNGGELSDPGAAQAFGNLCIGVSPELLVNANNSTTSAHTELEAGRDADFDPTLTAITNDSRAYDAAAFTAWVRPTVKMGAAFTEDLAALSGTPVDTASATLSGYAVQNNTSAAHLSGTTLIQDLVTFDVNDAYVLANTDHGTTLTFTGVVADLAGNVADASADAALTFRDQWPSYITSATRNADGTITVVFSQAVLLADGTTTITLQDTDTGPVSIDFINVAGVPSNYTQSADGRTLIRSISGLPESGGATYPGLFDTTTTDPLNYTDGSGADTQHAVVEFDAVYDTRGNRWLDHTGDITTPRFLMVDALPTYDVGDVTEDAPVPAGSATVTLTIPTNHATYNWFDSTLSDVTPATGAVVFPSTSCVNSATDASVTCPAMTTAGTLTYVAGSGTCTMPATYSLSLNAAHTLITATFTCTAGIVDTGDTLTFTYATAPVSDFDGTTDGGADTAVTAN
jgi:hypothetical protein